MIGQTKKVSVVQAHLKKLFSGVRNVQFNSSGNIIAIESPQNEIVNLDKPVQVSNQIEVFIFISIERLYHTNRSEVPNLF